jgi:hypothetical protein
MRSCPDKRCHVPDVACRLGEMTPADCLTWCKANEGEEPDPESKRDGSKTLFPWTGTALGTAELAFLTGRGDARLIAILGPHNAGKTTLLAAWYQHIGRSGKVGTVPFAGSFTLEGWEAVAHTLRWEGGVPSFPPHTSSGAGRTPGMLHLAIRDQSKELYDFLFADSPGEWFQRWAVDNAASDAEGARWLALRASAFLITADCEALAGSSRGSARSTLIQLVRRTASERRGRPTAIVWTKADIAIAPQMRTTIMEAARTAIPDIAEFSCSVTDFQLENQTITAEESAKAILQWTIEMNGRGVNLNLPDLPVDDPFFNFGIAL